MTTKNRRRFNSQFFHFQDRLMNRHNLYINLKEYRELCESVCIELGKKSKILIVCVTFKNVKLICYKSNIEKDKGRLITVLPKDQNKKYSCEN